MVTVGEPLPKHLFDYTQDSTISKVHRRRCTTCRHTWRTLEIPIVRGWKGEKVSRCPKNPAHGSSFTNSTTPFVTVEDILDKGMFVSPGILTAMLLGASYHRRRCLKTWCKNVSKGYSNGRRTAWSTYEVSATGLIVANVAACPRCARRGRLVSGPEKDYRPSYDKEV